MGEVVTTTHCSTAGEFLDTLSRRFEFRGPPGMWIYRGHEDDDYALSPTALRSESKRLWQLFHRPITNHAEQCRAEFRILKKFFKRSDLIGLPLPEDTQALREFFAEEPHDGKLWPPNHILSLMALAQHHGLPTRLLDWSRHPLKAALFAAFGAAKHKDKTGMLSVWALSVAMLDLTSFASSCLEELKLTPFTLITAPGATNSNLHAQEGVFTMARSIKSDESPVDRRPFDELIAQWESEHPGTWEGSWFKRITLPKIEAERLCVELTYEGITRATLFPNYSGVVEAIEAEQEWYH